MSAVFITTPTHCLAAYSKSPNSQRITSNPRTLTAVGGLVRHVPTIVVVVAEPARVDADAVGALELVVATLARRTRLLLVLPTDTVPAKK